MATITAYKCDVCKKVFEEPLSFTLEAFIGKKPRYRFSVDATDPLSYEDGACSISCVLAELNRWYEATMDAREAESKKQEPADDHIDLIQMANQILAPVEN